MKSTVAAIQMSSGDDVATNLSVAAQHLEAAADQGAKLAVLPENFAFMGANERAKLSVCEPPTSGPIQGFLSDIARRLKLWVVAGSVPLAVENDPERVWPACLVFDDGGRCVARYNKIHLFDVSVEREGKVDRYQESRHFVRGDWKPIVVDTPVGKLGLSICYDLRFPELYREMSKAGAELLSIPAAFTENTGEAHWEPLLRARAIENQCIVIAPGQYGKHPDGRRTWGHSMIIDAWGKVLAQRDSGEAAVLAEYELEQLHALRERFPALSHRRG